MKEREFLKVLEQEQKLLTEAAAALSAAAASAVAAVFDTQIKRLRDVLEIDANGDIKDSEDALKLILEIENEILQAISGDSFSKPILKEYVRSAEQVKAFEAAAHEQVNNIDLGKIETTLSDTQKAIADALLFQLTEMNVKGVFLREFKQTIYAAIAGNWSYKTLTKRMRDVYSADSPKLNAAAARVANDTIRGYQGAINAAVAERYNLPYIYYSGSLVEGSRPFCRHIVDKLNRYIERSKLAALLKEYLADPAKARGMFEGTNEDNFLQYRGGRGCLHTATALRRKFTG